MHSPSSGRGCGTNRDQLDRRDQRLIMTAQGVRALAYGYSAVLLGIDLDHRGLSRIEVGIVLSSVIAGSALGLLVVSRVAERIGRRRVYIVGYLLLILAGIILAFSPWWWPLVVVALTGTLSAEVMDSGPFTALEQAMLSSLDTGVHRLRSFGRYNAIATAGGSLGALLAAGVGAASFVKGSFSSPTSPGSGAFLLILPLAVVGAACAFALSSAVELEDSLTTGTSKGNPNLGRDRQDKSHLLPSSSSARKVILRLSLLFGIDSFGSSFAVQAFVAYWLSTRYGASTEMIGVLFFALGLIQTTSMFVATRLGERFGLLPTMVFTHLPSNILLAAVAFAPSFPIAACLLVAQSALSEMDVPTRQSYVMALVPPEDRIGAASVTGLARYGSRPVGPILAGVAQGAFVGFPFLIAGVIKGCYDLSLWTWFRRVTLPDQPTKTVAK